MMREIKFRAWDLKNKGFVAGFNMVNYHDYYNADLKPSIYRYDTEWVDGGYILEQFTGLKDKTGRDIYEGDIANIEGGADKPALCSVIFKDGCFCLDWEYNDSNPELKYYIDMSFCDFEVAGNIHENPELLK